jgi:4a-hydroxytetrahydrobiopterin dehydratase
VILTPLSLKACIPCTRNSSPLDESELTECLDQLPDWKVVERNNVQLLQKSFAIRPYKKAMGFVMAVGELAETENHHPELLLEWGRVTVSWWTHTISGLHINDCILAARCDELFSQSGSESESE